MPVCSFGKLAFKTAVHIVDQILSDTRSDSGIDTVMGPSSLPEIDESAE